MLKKSTKRALSIREAQHQLASGLQHFRDSIERYNYLWDTQVLQHIIGRNYVKEFVELREVIAKIARQRDVSLLARSSEVSKISMP